MPKNDHRKHHYRRLRLHLFEESITSALLQYVIMTTLGMDSHLGYPRKPPLSRSPDIATALESKTEGRHLVLLSRPDPAGVGSSVKLSWRGEFGDFGDATFGRYPSRRGLTTLTDQCSLRDGRSHSTGCLGGGTNLLRGLLTEHVRLVKERACMYSGMYSGGGDGDGLGTDFLAVFSLQPRIALRMQGIALGASSVPCQDNRSRVSEAVILSQSHM
jgi:hypothetical protein